MIKKICTAASAMFFLNPLAIAIGKEQAQQLYHDYVQNKLMFQAGFYGPHQGQNQHVAINDLIGDQFSVTQSGDINALIGLGYYLDGRQFSKIQWQYGLDVMYLIQSTVKGNVAQENLFTNLSYAYHISNVPIYAAVKAITDTPKEGYQLYVDGGIGPNIMITSGFSESPLNRSTLSEKLFKGATTTTFSAMAGVGVRTTKWMEHPMECGYRFLYLGAGRLNPNNSQVMSSLSTGQTYAHSLVCGLTF